MAHYDVSGRHVLVTGGANGIGLETARRLAARGAKTSLLDNDTAALDSAAAGIGAAAEPFVCDVTDAGSVESAVAAARERLGPVDVVIASAGVSGKPTPVLELEDAEFERVVGINLFGVWRTIRCCLPDVVERKGYLLPIASLAAGVATPLIAPYGASKAGVHSLGRALRMELAHTGVKVGTGYFSLIDTNMVRNAMADPHVKRGMKAIPRALGKPASVERAGEAMARGVEKRARRVCVPRWVSPVMSLNGMGGGIEWLAARDPRFIRSLKAKPEDAPALEEVTSDE
jgi:NAD(P)-dependent dehydrogenase (short-subunit alcohol dehydrogenase family)